MMSGDLAGKIKGAVFALIAGIIILYLVPVNFAAADALNRHFHDHCRIGAESIRAVQITAVSGITTLSPEQMRVYEVKKPDGSNGCEVPPQAKVAYAGAALGDGTNVIVTLTSDSGSSADVEAGTDKGYIAWSSAIAFASGNFGVGVWTQPGDVMKQFIGVNRLITSILPVLITIGLFTVVGFGAMKLWKGEGMASAIAAEVGTVILVVIVMNLAPSMFDAIGEGATANAGQYGVTAQFSGITDLLFGLLPLLVVLSLIGLLAWRGYSGYKAMTGQGKRGSAVSEVVG